MPPAVLEQHTATLHAAALAAVQSGEYVQLFELLLRLRKLGLKLKRIDARDAALSDHVLLLLCTGQVCGPRSTYGCNQHTCARVCAHTRTTARLHMHAYARMLTPRTRTHARMHARTHTQARTLIHTYTRSSILMPRLRHAYATLVLRYAYTCLLHACARLMPRLCATLCLHMFKPRLRIHAYTQAGTNTCTHTCAHARTCARMHAPARARTHPLVHTLTHVCSEM